MAWEIWAYLEDDKMISLVKTEKPLGNVKPMMQKFYEHGVFERTPKTLVYYPSKLIKKIEAIEVK